MTVGLFDQILVGSRWLWMQRQLCVTIRASGIGPWLLDIDWWQERSTLLWYFNKGSRMEHF